MRTSAMRATPSRTSTRYTLAASCYMPVTTGIWRRCTRLDQEMRKPTELELFRSAKDKFYAQDDRAPLTPEQQRSFKALSYFPENEAFIVKAKVDRHVDP